MVSCELVHEQLCGSVFLGLFIIFQESFLLILLLSSSGGVLERMVQVHGAALTVRGGVHIIVAVLRRRGLQRGSDVGL